MRQQTYECSSKPLLTFFKGPSSPDPSLTTDPFLCLECNPWSPVFWVTYSPLLPQVLRAQTPILHLLLQKSNNTFMCLTFIHVKLLREILIEEFLLKSLKSYGSNLHSTLNNDSQKASDDAQKVQSGVKQKFSGLVVIKK